MKLRYVHKLVFVILLLLGTGEEIRAQGKKGRTTEVGLNMTGILKQVVPFNRSGPIPLSYAVTLSRINRKGSGALRLSLGASSSQNNNDFFSFTEFNLNLLIGYEKRKQILNSKVGYRSGFHLFGNGGFLPSALPTGAGIAISQGLSYDLSERINISTEAMLYFGADLSFFMDFVEPIAIYLNVKL